MNLKSIKEKLSKYEEQKVNNFLAYLHELATDKNSKGDLKAWWLSKVNDNQLIQAFKKVYNQGLNIDGESVSLTFRGKMQITYDYHAYKNKVMIKYPESVFDISLVNEGDTFSFQKTSGKIEYQHNIKNPFETGKKVIGAYCIIKNKRGEFLETINTDDIDKMRSVAKTQDIWNKWFDRMVMKSIIKRSCSTHFKDEVKDIDEIDNLNYDLTMEHSELTDDIKKDIRSYLDEFELMEFANSNEMKEYQKNKEFIKLIDEQRKIIELNQKES